MGAGKVHGHLVPSHGDLHPDIDGVGHQLAAAVHEILELIHAVRNLADRAPHHPVGIVLNLLHAVQQHIAVLGISALELLDSDQVGGYLGCKVAPALFPGTGIAQQHIHHIPVYLAIPADADDGNPDTLLKHRPGVAHDAAWYAAANVRMVGDIADPGNQLIPGEDWGANRDVRQMVAAAAVRVVQDKHIPGVDFLGTVFFQDALGNEQRSGRRRPTSCWTIWPWRSGATARAAPALPC